MGLYVSIFANNELLLNCLNSQAQDVHDGKSTASRSVKTKTILHQVC